MGNTQESLEISLQEQELFELQVEEEYNPLYCQMVHDMDSDLIEMERKKLQQHMHGKQHNLINDVRQSVVPLREQKLLKGKKAKYVFLNDSPPDQKPKTTNQSSSQVEESKEIPEFCQFERRNVNQI